jgi:hypothetical protein
MELVLLFVIWEFFAWPPHESGFHDWFVFLELLSCIVSFDSYCLQPGPRDFLLQCFIKRCRSAQTYRVYLGLNNGE